MLGLGCVGYRVNAPGFFFCLRGSSSWLHDTSPKKHGHTCRYTCPIWFFELQPCHKVSIGSSRREHLLTQLDDGSFKTSWILWAVKNLCPCPKVHALRVFFQPTWAVLAFRSPVSDDMVSSRPLICNSVSSSLLRCCRNGNHAVAIASEMVLCWLWWFLEMTGLHACVT